MRRLRGIVKGHDGPKKRPAAARAAPAGALLMEDSSGVIIRERLSYASPPHIPAQKTARARETHTGALPHLYACPPLTYLSLSSREWYYLVQGARMILHVTLSTLSGLSSQRCDTAHAPGLPELPHVAPLHFLANLELGRRDMHNCSSLVSTILNYQQFRHCD